MADLKSVYREKSSETIIFMCIIEKVTAIGRVTAIGYRPAIGCNIYIKHVCVCYIFLYAPAHHFN